MPSAVLQSIVIHVSLSLFSDTEGELFQWKDACGAYRFAGFIKPPRQRLAMGGIA